MTRRKVPFMSRTRLVMTQPRPGFSSSHVGLFLPCSHNAGAQIRPCHAPLHHSATVNLTPPKQRRRDCRPRTLCSDVTRAKTLLCPEIIPLRHSIKEKCVHDMRSVGALSHTRRALAEIEPLWSATHGSRSVLTAFGSSRVLAVQRISLTSSDVTLNRMVYFLLSEFYITTARC